MKRDKNTIRQTQKDRETEKERYLQYNILYNFINIPSQHLKLTLWASEWVNYRLKTDHMYVRVKKYSTEKKTYNIKHRPKTRKFCRVWDLCLTELASKVQTES